MVERTLNLTYKRQPLRVTLEPEGAWVPSEDLSAAIGLKDPKVAVSKLPEHEKSLRQIGGRGVRMRVLSVEGVQRLAGSTRVAGAADFLDWFRAQAMPQISLALQDIASEEEPIKDPALEAAVMVSGLVLDAGHAFLYDKLPVRLQVDAKGEILFNANDVCEALELGNPWQAIASHVDAEDLQKMEALTAGGPQQVNYVNLSGLYALVFGSKKDAARKFKRWVTHEVLPSIQKTGTYSLARASQSVPFQAIPERERLARLANTAGLAASVGNEAEAQKVLLQARVDLAKITEAERHLRDMHIEIQFKSGLGQPTACATYPEPLLTREGRAAAGKALAGRIYLVEFEGSLDRPRVRPLQVGEHVVKASVDGIKFLANRTRFGLEEWSDIEEWARRKVQSRKNMA